MKRARAGAGAIGPIGRADWRRGAGRATNRGSETTGAAAMRTALPALLAALLLAGAASAPKPAAAQATTTICVVNDAGIIMRSRIYFRDWRNDYHVSGWAVTALGQRNCQTKQDISNLQWEIEVQAVAAGWRQICIGRLHVIGRQVTIRVTGTLSDWTCTMS